jgi:hypothetical protein
MEGHGLTKRTEERGVDMFEVVIPDLSFSLRRACGVTDLSS